MLPIEYIYVFFSFFQVQISNCLPTYDVKKRKNKRSGPTTFFFFNNQNVLTDNTNQRFNNLSLIAVFTLHSGFLMNILLLVLMLSFFSLLMIYYFKSVIVNSNNFCYGYDTYWCWYELVISHFCIYCYFSFYNKKFAVLPD